jgi:hypothetical protein
VPTSNLVVGDAASSLERLMVETCVVPDATGVRAGPVPVKSTR